MEEKINVLEMVADGFSAVSEDTAESNPIQSAMVGALGYVYRRATEAAEKGDPVAWVSFSVPTEIFWAMDIVPVCDIGLTVFCAIPGAVEKYIDLAEEFIPQYVCSTNKLPMGLLLSGDAPLPNVYVAQNNPCDSILGVDSSVAKYLGLPYFGIGTPYLKSEKGYLYTARELKRMVTWLENHTGRKMDFGRLQQAMKYSNQAHELVLKINALAAQVPCPFPMPESASLYPLFMNLPGTPELVNCLETLYREIQHRVNNKVSPVPFEYEEKLRLVWIYAMPGFDFPNSLNELMQEYGAVSIIYMNNHITVVPTEDLSDYDKILLGLARKSRNMPMSKEGGGPWEDWGDNSVEMVRYYKADGAVFAGHIACKSNWAAAKLVKDKVLEETGIPTISIELDFIDGRVTPAEAIKSQLVDFIELILARGKQ
ncbi:MAG: 2-hydroxyacyl-CoA dehydratase family protein [Dehalococcoidia bacterium]|nr:2-hydroxyacyl-CoA dehydratase family protein [Dehalococcoidia bacterium]